MDFLREKQALMYTSKNFENIYKLFNDKFGIQYSKLFTLLAVVGAKTNRRIPYNSKGREFRSNYLTRDEAYSLYSILLNDPESMFYNDISKFEDETTYSKARELLQSYAEGGLTDLIDNVLSEYWDGENLVEDYPNYIKDIAEYILDINNTVPF